MKTLENIVLALVLTASCVVAEESEVKPASDWRCWLGNDRTGVSPAKNLISEWPATGPEILWKIPTGIAWSCPIIYENLLYITSLEDKYLTESVRCLEADTGKEVWKYSYAADYFVPNQVKQEKMEYPEGGFRGAPSATSKYLYTIGAKGHFFCFDRLTGSVIWEKNLDKEYPTSSRAWKGWTISPLVEEGKVIVNLGPDPKKQIQRCAAFNAETGKEEWFYSSPVKIVTTVQVSQTPQVTTYEGEKYILYSPYCKLSALRISDGKELFSYQLSAGNNEIATPALFGDRVFVCPFEKEEIMLEIKKENEEYHVREVWKTKNSPAGHAGYMPYNGSLFGFASFFPLVCLNQDTGEIRWAKYGFKIDSSLMIADGKLYIRSGKDLIIAEATGAGYKELSKYKFDVETGPKDYIGWNHPIIANGKMYVRFSKEMYCINVTKK